MQHFNFIVNPVGIMTGRKTFVLAKTRIRHCRIIETYVL